MNITAHLQLHRRPSHLEVLIFTKHMSTMIKAGITVSDALATITEQTDSQSFRSILSNIAKDVQNGQTLTKSMGRYPKTFNQLYISLIEISEHSGTLEENLDFIAKQLAKSYSLERKIQSALLYPSVIIIAATLMGGFISFLILPQLVDFFSAFNIELPLTTQVLLWIAHTMKNHGLSITVGLLITASALRLAVENKHIKPYWHSLLLKLPIIGKFITTALLAQITRNFGVLVKSGVPTAQSIEITANTISNLRYRKDLLELSSALRKGKNISDSLRKGRYDEIPSLVSKMIAVGEKTGNLDDSLLYLGEYYEEELDNFSKNITTILEPVLLVVIGLVVGFVALAIITPIYELTGSIRR